MKSSKNETFICNFYNGKICNKCKEERKFNQKVISSLQNEASKQWAKKSFIKKLSDITHVLLFIIENVFII